MPYALQALILEQFQSGTRSSRFDGTNFERKKLLENAAIGRRSSPLRPSSTPAHGRRGSHHGPCTLCQGSGAKCRGDLPPVHALLRPKTTTKEHFVNKIPFRYFPIFERFIQIFIVIRNTTMLNINLVIYEFCDCISR